MGTEGSSIQGIKRKPLNRFTKQSVLKVDGYSEEWKAEAARRGLTNICHVPEAILKFNDKQSRAVLIGEKIFNENELFCRIEVETGKVY